MKADLSTRFRRFQKLLRDGNLAAAVKRGREFLAANPDFGPGWTMLGDALISMARYDEAEQALARGIELCEGGGMRIALTKMGDSYQEKGEFTNAAQWYQRAIDAAPDHAHGYTYLGGVLAKQGLLAEAEKIHRKGIRCTEGCVDEAYLNLGLVLRAQDRFEEAAECFREAIRRDPSYREAMNALKDTELCLGIDRQARRTP